MKKTVIAMAAALAIGMPGVALAQGNGGGTSHAADQGKNYATQNLPSQRVVNNTENGRGAALVISGAGVREVQQALNRLGYNAGTITGNWDRKTITAMKNFQGAHGLDPTGNLDISSIAALGLWNNLIGNPLGTGHGSLISSATGAPPPRGNSTGMNYGPNGGGGNNGGGNNGSGKHG